MANNPLVNIFRIQELRKRILFTIGLLVVFRLGIFIPIPGIDFSQVMDYYKSVSTGGTSANILDYLDLFVGGAFRNFSIFMLGIMPYITTSIIMQLLVLVFPKLKKIQEEEGGRKKIQRISRYVTIPVCFVQSFVITRYVDTIAADYPTVLTIGRLEFTLLAMLTITAGTIFLMWLGEQITQRGIGNGISLLIFAGIAARIPDAFLQLGLLKSFLKFVEDIALLLGLVTKRGIIAPILSTGGTEGINPVFILMALVMFVVVVGLIIYEQRGQRKIPVHYAKRIVGRRMYGAQNTYIPLKLNPSGVIPIIFANALLIFPIQIAQNLAKDVPWLVSVAQFLRPNGIPYLIIYAILIVGFSFFYTQVTLNPVEIAKNIRENGGSIPGIRSEKMESYLQRILNRIILPGSLFLAFIAIIPSIVTMIFNFPSTVSRIMGGTSLIIMVSVGLDTMSQVEGHLRMHHHEGLVKKGRIKSRNL